MPRQTVSERFPLPCDEQRALVRASLLSEAIIGCAGVLVAAILCGLSGGGLFGAVAFGWVTDLAQHMTLHWAALALPVALLLFVAVIDSVGKRRSSSYSQAKVALAQGINGEIPRLSLGLAFLLMALAGICEELLFRYALIGLAMLGFGMLVPPVPAAVLSVAVATAIFVAAHFQYRDPWSVSIVVAIALVLSVAYVLTGSLLSVMIAHAVYNAGIILIERKSMLSDPDYFGGKMPTRVALDLKAR